MLPHCGLRVGGGLDELPFKDVSWYHEVWPKLQGFSPLLRQVMDASSNGGLKRRLDEIDAELHLVRREDYRLSERLRKINVTEKQKPRSLSKSLTLMVLFLYQTCSCNAEVPIHFLEGAGRSSKFKRQQHYPGEFRELAEYLYLTAHVNLLVQLDTSPLGLLSRKHLWKVCLYIVEYNIFEFSLSANHDKGVAPGASLLGSQWEILIPSTLPARQQEALKLLLLESTVGRKCWLSRFRKRWGIKHGELPSEKMVSLEELQIQVRVFFGLVNYTLESLEKTGNNILLINLDETNVLYSVVQQQYGMVVRKTHPVDKRHSLLASNRKRCGRRPVQQQLPQQHRGSVTLVSMCCNDSSIQPALPQIIIGNEHKFTHTLLCQARDQGVPQNIHLWRAKSSWMSSCGMKQVISLLKRSLSKYPETHEIVLLLDCAGCHLESSVLAHARRSHVHLLIVPASATGLLQPLDTHGFAWLKNSLREKLGCA